MNLRDLSYLVAVADYRSFSEAAHHCSIGQPTLSTQIKKLEEFLGVQIFVRQKRNVEITEVGKQVVSMSRKILSDAHNLRQFAAQSNASSDGLLSIGAFPSLASYVLPEYVFRIKQHYPDIKIQLVEEKTDSLIQLLLDGKIDTALLATPVENGQFYWRRLFDDPFKLAVSVDHPLANQKVVDINAIETDSLLLLEEGHCLRDQALENCDPSRFVEHDFRASSLETLRFLVKNGVGITLMPSVAIQPDDTDIRYIGISQQPMRTIALVWRLNHPRTGFLDKLATLLSYKPLL